MVKTCIKCGIEKPATSEYFSKDKIRKSGKQGIQGICRDCRKERAREYHKTHRKQESIKQKEYRQVNKASKVASDRKYQREHITERKISGHKRKARKLSLPNTLTVAQWEKVKEFFDFKCCYCGKEKSLAQDHFLALSSGGEYAITNIVPSCQSCNSSKGPRSFFTWYKSQPFYSKKREDKILKYLGYKKNVQQLSFV